MFLPRSLQSTVRSGSPEPSSETLKQLQIAMNRRRFLTGLGAAGAVAGTAMVTGCGSTMTVGAQTPTSNTDTAVQIFTAALIAEDLAITMYYNALIGGVIQDPNLSGTGGTAVNVTANGSLANVGYLRGALAEEISHANLLRSVLNISASSGDPVQTFYFPTGTFDNLTNFFPIIIALETAFIAAYMTAVEEFALMLGDVTPYSGTQISAAGTTYAKTDLASFAKISAAILGVEAEHRTLARAIPTHLQRRQHSAIGRRLLRIDRHASDGVQRHEFGSGGAGSVPCVRLGDNGFLPANCAERGSQRAVGLQRHAADVREASETVNE